MLLMLLMPALQADCPEYTNGETVVCGPKVYVSTDKYYAAASPHTLHESGWVTFDFILRSEFGDTIDFLWGFDTPDTRPRRPQIWRNYSHPVPGWKEEMRQYDFYNITSFDKLGIENYSNYQVDYGNDNNSKLYRVYFEDAPTIIIAFSQWSGNTDHAIVSLNDEYWVNGADEEWYFDWKPFEKDYEVYNIEMVGMNKWYAVEDVSLQVGKKYSMRIWVETQINSDGKYWFGGKPHSMSLQIARQQDKFFAIDPWWDATWSSCKAIDIANANNSYPIMINISKNVGNTVNCSDHCNDNFSDIRFVDIDNVTALEQYLAYNGTGWANFWVKLPADIETDNKILMYYNKADATPKSDGTHVFETFYNSSNLTQFSVTHADAGTGFTANVTHLVLLDGNVGGYCAAEAPISVSTKDMFMVIDQTIDDHGSGDDVCQQRLYDGGTLVTAAITPKKTDQTKWGVYYSGGWQQLAYDIVPGRWILYEALNESTDKGNYSIRNPDMEVKSSHYWKGVWNSYATEIDKIYIETQGNAYTRINFKYFAFNRYIEATPYPSAVGAEFAPAPNAAPEVHWYGYQNVTDKFSTFYTYHEQIFGDQWWVSNDTKYTYRLWDPWDTSLVNHSLRVIINDTEFDDLNVTFRTNASGTWVDLCHDNHTIYVGSGKWIYWNKLDVTDDGKINQDDVDALVAHFGDVDAYNLSIYDLDDNGMIIASDVSLLTWSPVWNHSVGEFYCKNTSFATCYNTKYWWSVNATDGNSWENETFSFITLANTNLVPFTRINGRWNYYPWPPILGQWHENMSANISLMFSAFNSRGNNMNLSVWTNISGAWLEVQNWTNVSMGLYYTNLSVTLPNTWYWFSVNATDVGDYLCGSGGWYNATIKFKSKELLCYWTYTRVNRTVTFSSSPYVKGTPDMYLWEFGDAFEPYSYWHYTADPIHTYHAAGNFTCTLTVETNDGLRESFSKVINIPGVVVDAGVPFLDIPFEFIIAAVFIIVLFAILSIVMKQIKSVGGKGK